LNAAGGARKAMGPLQRGLLRGPPGQQPNTQQAVAAASNFVGPLAYYLMAARRARHQHVPTTMVRSSWGETPLPNAAGAAPAWQTLNSADWAGGGGSDLSDQSPADAGAHKPPHPQPHAASMSCEFYRPLRPDVRMAWGASGEDGGADQGAGASLGPDAHVTYTVSATTPLGDVMKPAPHRRRTAAEGEAVAVVAAGGDAAAEAGASVSRRRATADGVVGSSLGSSSPVGGLADGVGGELGTGELGMQPYEPN
ncbi:hypothetical protein PLESTB_000492700, partial [Pleodorina starrii]